MGSKAKRGPRLFMIQHGPLNDQELSLYNVLEDRWDNAKISTLCDQTIIPCNFGWFALVNPFTDDCSLWNPESKEIIQLPELPSSNYLECVLSKQPTEPGCHVLFNALFELAFCEIGGDEFVKIQMPMTMDNKQEQVENVETWRLFHGNIYALVAVGYEKRLVMISFVGKTLELKSILNISPLLQPRTQIVRYYLIDDDEEDEMLLVCSMSPTYYLYHYFDFKIYRIDINTLDYCVELLDIGERAIFLSIMGYTFCRSSVTTGIRSNSIYFIKTGVAVDFEIYTLDKRGTISLQLTSLVAHPIFPRSYWIEHNFSLT